MGGLPQDLAPFPPGGWGRGQVPRKLPTSAMSSLGRSLDISGLLLVISNSQGQPSYLASIGVSEAQRLY